jgi:hypothetical protein
VIASARCRWRALLWPRILPPGIEDIGACRAFLKHQRHALSPRVEGGEARRFEQKGGTQNVAIEGCRSLEVARVEGGFQNFLDGQGARFVPVGGRYTALPCRS